MYSMAEVGVLGSGTGKEKALGRRASIEDVLPARRVEEPIAPESLIWRGYSESIAQVFGHFIRYRDIQRLIKREATEPTSGFVPHRYALAAATYWVGEKQ